MNCSAATRESRSGWEHFTHDADIGVNKRSRKIFAGPYDLAKDCKKWTRMTGPPSRLD